jgi:hypothetical protein
VGVPKLPKLGPPQLLGPIIFSVDLRVKDICDEILIGKTKTIRNNYNAQLEHVGNKDLINVSKKISIQCQRLWEVFSRKKTNILRSRHSQQLSYLG